MKKTPFSFKALQTYSVCFSQTTPCAGFAEKVGLRSTESMQRGVLQHLARICIIEIALFDKQRPKMLLYLEINCKFFLTLCVLRRPVANLLSLQEGNDRIFFNPFLFLT